MKKYLGITVAVLFVVLLILIISNVASRLQKFATSQKADVTTSATQLERSYWKTYTDKDAGFSFRYPATSELKNTPFHYTSSKLPTVLLVSTYNLKTMEDLPLGYSKQSLVAVRDDLKSGKMKTAISGLYAREELITRIVEVCDVQFNHTLDIFDGEDTMIHIRYVISDSHLADAINNNARYFTVDSKNCNYEDGQHSQIWRDQDGFLTDLTAGKTDTITQNWHNNYSRIAESFTFTSSSTD